MSETFSQWEGREDRDTIKEGNNKLWIVKKVVKENIAEEEVEERKKVKMAINYETREESIVNKIDLFCFTAY